MSQLTHYNVWFNIIIKIIKICLILHALHSPITNQQINAFLLKCPLYQMHLQKIVGFRLPVEYMTSDNLIYKEYHISNNVDLRNVSNVHHHAKRDYFQLQQPRNRNDYIKKIITEELLSDTTSNICWRLCYKNEDCIAYVHLLKSKECYGYTYFEKPEENFMRIYDDSVPLVADNEAIFYEKSCLNVPKSCKERLWTLTKIPGYSLVLQGKKTLSTLVSRRKCAEACLFEKEFQCLSVSFAPSYRNNRNRSAQAAATKTLKEQQSTLGRCILSDQDKMTHTSAFRAASFEEEYIENQCHDRRIENNQCSYELYANSTFIYADNKIIGLTQQECQTYCSRETKFYCQGVSFYYDDTIDKSECLLHSEDIISLGPRSLQFRQNAVYMRRVNCLNVQVTCTPNEMLIKYIPKDWFHGKLYVSGHFDFCTTDGNGTQTTILRLAIGNETTENRCGVLRAYEVTNEHQRTFISTLVVIQNNPNVQTQGDRLIKVGCIISNVNNIMSNKYKIVPIAQQNNFENGVMLENENGPNAIALQASLNFSKSKSSLLYNNSNNYDPMPTITLEIIDINRNKSTRIVQIGQYLQLQIVAEYTEEQLGEFSKGGVVPLLADIQATSLMAVTENKEKHILLIDKYGCPTDSNIFPPLKRIRSPTKNTLYTKFRAFKFAGTTNVKFEVEVHFCKAKCPLDNCVKSNRH